MSNSIQNGDFDLSREVAALRAGDARVGAVAVFVGTVRDLNDAATVTTMTLEHYPGMTEKALATIESEARARWQIFDVRIIHRVGELKPQDQIVLVAVTSAHRGEAFAACEFIMDFLKTRAPFWKKEAGATGSRWVEARAADDVAAARWDATGVAATAGAKGGVAGAATADAREPLPPRPR
jgi:molybdopterin synthase catalytic subunit